ncbi:MAG: Cobalt-zinc-cadmium resistance protein CzcA [Candidatus Omnitrophica bacterium]|nr:Cobalt-zinc-cadmium resistance protein CzcA [Candidatus Omnitrophota bacterium]
MSLPASSIRRPIATLMFYVGILLFGLISLNLLKQELFPPITYPQLSVVTPYANAAPEEIETLITKPIEEAVGGISGLRKVTSTSREGLSLVVVEFGWNTHMDFASLSVREKIDLIKERLPRDAQEPVVIKFNPFELPVMSISVSSAERSPVQLRELARKWFKDELEKLNGVASAAITGGEEEQILVDVDQGKLRAAGMSISDVSDAINNANLNYPGGTIKESFYEYLVRTIGEFKRAEEIDQVPVKREHTKAAGRGEVTEDEPSNRLLLLKDVADVTRTVKERTSFSRFNGRENVTVAVQKQAASNTILVADMVRRKLKDLQEQLPKDIHIDIVYDQSKFIREALNGVKDAAIQGGFLAFFVLLVFLRDLKSSMLVVTITPVTILATYTLMYFLGISLNVISLGGVALGVGMLLDNAVVVIENVYRNFREKPAEGIDTAARVGSEEVMAPMVASTLTTVSVFLPIVFVTGIAGQIFKELAWVVVVTQVISAIIAFTLLPMLIAKVGKSSSLAHRDIFDEENADKARPRLPLAVRMYQGFLRVFGRPIDWIERTYVRLLPSFIERKGMFLFMIFLVFVGSLFVLATMERVLLPKVDQGQFMVKVDMPVGTRVEITDGISRKIENFIGQIPEVRYTSAVVGSSRGDSTKDILERLGSNQAQIIVNLRAERKRGTDEVVQEIRRYFELSAGSDLVRPARLSYVLYESAFKVGSDIDAPIVVEIKGPKLDELRRIALKTQETLSAIPGVYGIANSIAEAFPETKIIINKDRASYYKLSVVSIAQAANIAMKGIIASKFKEEGREIDIRVQLKETDRDQFQKLGLLTVYSPLDMVVPMSDFVRFERGRGPSEIKRVSQERTVQVYAKIYERGLSEVVKDVELALARMKVPDRYEVRLAGESEEIQESFASLQFAFTLSVVLVYMIMAAQFESLWQPFIIMFCLPLSLIGVAIALWVSSTPLSVVVILGIILLGGIVVNNGIILIDYLNQLRAQGMPLREAAMQAGRVRLRPILMTAFSSAIGLLPLALGIGEGAELQAPMAVAVMGGILMATFLTLVVIPSIYIGTEEMAQKVRSWRRKESSEPQAGLGTAQ